MVQALLENLITISGDKKFESSFYRQLRSAFDVIVFFRPEKVK